MGDRQTETERRSVVLISGAVAAVSRPETLTGPPEATAAVARVLLRPARWRRAKGSQIKAVAADRMSQQAKAPRQPRPVREIGMLIPEAMADHIFMDDVYKLVINPSRSGKSRLIRLGTSTLATAIALPTRAVPPKRAGTAGMERSRIPPVIRIMQYSSVRSMPKRDDNLGAASANTAKAMSGKVVSIPASVCDKPVEFWISSISGPTPVSGERSVAAVSITATISSVAAAPPATVFSERVLISVFCFMMIMNPLCVFHG